MNIRMNKYVHTYAFVIIEVGISQGITLMQTSWIQTLTQKHCLLTMPNSTASHVHSHRHGCTTACYAHRHLSIAQFPHDRVNLDIAPHIMTINKAQISITSSIAINWTQVSIHCKSEIVVHSKDQGKLFCNYVAHTLLTFNRALTKGWYNFYQPASMSYKREEQV